MSELLPQFYATVISTLRDVAPIALVVIIFQTLVLRRRLPDAGTLALGFSCVLLGLVFFLMGLETALFTLGRTMAEKLVASEFLAHVSNSAEPLVEHWREYYWLYLFAFAIGASAVIVEPAVIAVTMKASELSAGAINATALRIVIAYSDCARCRHRGGTWHFSYCHRYFATVVYRRRIRTGSTANFFHPAQNDSTGL